MKTDSFARMDKLKLLLLKDVRLTGSYKNFPELRWLYWERCPLKRMHHGFLLRSLVAIHMNYGKLKEFEPPMVGIRCSFITSPFKRPLSFKMCLYE